MFDMAPHPIQSATGADLPEALALLSAAGLPTAGVTEQFPDGYLVVRDPESGAIVAVVGTEWYAVHVLLRSLAVAEVARGKGWARKLVRTVFHLAEIGGMRALYLLTTTAEGYFARLGFERISHDDLPAELGASEELRGACPVSAVVMRLRL